MSIHTKRLTPEERGVAFKYVASLIRWHADNGSTRFCFISDENWYTVVREDRRTLIRLARSHEITILVAGTDAEDLPNA